MIDYDYQVSVIERTKDNMGFDKDNLDKVEITFDFQSYNAKTEKNEKSIIRMGCFEFQEIFEQFKKIDNQLHLFKN